MTRYLKPTSFVRAEPLWDIDAFEPTISATTMLIHTTSLHQKYVNNLNAMLSNSPQIASVPPSDLLSNLSFYLSEQEKEMYLNNMGGSLAHTLFWYCLSPKPLYPISKIERTNIGKTFGLDEETLTKDIKSAAQDRIGSGWVWLALDSNGFLKVYSTINHVTPYMRKQTPLLCLDFWEHAYFLDVHSNKNQWLDNVLQFVDFAKVDIIFNHLQKGTNLLDKFVMSGSLS